MMPATLVRTLAAMALPAALTAAAIGRKREQTRRGTPESPTVPMSTPNQAILDRKALRTFLLEGGDPHAVSLTSARLDGIDLAARDLTGLDLSSASLRRSILVRARLDRACLNYADLSRANLQHAKFGAASLVDANLWRADVRGADFHSCGTIGVANLRGARYDKSTRWLPGFDPTIAGAILSADGSL